LHDTSGVATSIVVVGRFAASCTITAKARRTDVPVATLRLCRRRASPATSRSACGPSEARSCRARARGGGAPRAVTMSLMALIDGVDARANTLR
jgi:hypothetical protein